MSVALPRQASEFPLHPLAKIDALFTAEDSLSPLERKKYVKTCVCDVTKGAGHGTEGKPSASPCSARD